MEIRGDVYIDWLYPEIYGNEKPKNKITIAIEHTRAVCPITIEFDSEENSWVIMMDKTKDMGGYSDTVKENEIVATIPAWNEDYEEDPHPGRTDSCL